MNQDQHSKLYPGCGQEQPGALNRQEAGDHYACMKIQPIEFAVANQLGPCETLALKYLCRHRRKNGAEDIRKAIHSLELLLALEYGETTCSGV